jgi:cytochrome P450
MVDMENTNYFKDLSLVADPYPYYEYLREQGGAVHLPQHGIVATVGYDETLAVFRDDDRFSALNATSGPFPGLPFTPTGDDISEQIEAHRGEMAFGGLIATQDPPVHTRTRSLMAGIITPRRLRDNEQFMWRLADSEIDTFIGKGRFEVCRELGLPFTTKAIADLLGVPEEEHVFFAERLSKQGVVPGQIGGEAQTRNNPLEEVGIRFYGYLSERRTAPRGDVLTELAQATYQDGTLPPLEEVIGIAAFLFAAGQDTTVSLISAALRILAEDQELQTRLRGDRKRIPDFIEEVLRLEGTVKSNFRLAKIPVTVGDLDLPAGTSVMLNMAAANRDPKRFEHPDEIILERKNLREHLSFGRGIHACPGSPLARTEAKIVLERIFDRLGEFRIDEQFHGPRDARRFKYKPSFMFRVLDELRLEFDPLD